VEYGARAGRATSLVTVRSSIDEQWARLQGPVPMSFKAKDALGHELDEAADEDESSWKDFSFEARLLRSDERRRRTPPCRQLAEQAELTELGVPFDGSDVKMTVASDKSGRWAALTEVGGVTVKVAGNDFDPATLRLVAIANPIAYFDRDSFS
jgi:hypothetical protein